MADRNHEIHEYYEADRASAENAVKIFEGQWVSTLPGFDIGSVPLFHDHRVKWSIDQAGGLAGKNCLELGPLEGGHTFMMHSAGAASITVIEANSRCYLKCLVVKELYNLINAKLLFGDFVSWVASTKQKFDYIHASGVLYHLVDPISTLNSLCSLTDQIYIWTHYADLSAMSEKDPRYVEGVVKQESVKVGSKSFVGLRRKYNTNSKADPKFCGGIHLDPIWIEKNAILEVLAINGFQTRIEHDSADHPGGPSCSIFAQR
jgi:Protein of unknown function (DUF1698)